MPPRLPLLLLAALVLGACQGSPHAGASPALTPQERIEITGDVRVFALEVAQDVTQQGPAAWARHFSKAPEFFMASEGDLQFADGNSAARGIEELTHAIKRIELRFGDDLRVDPLTPDYAVVAASFSEVQTDADDKETSVNGFFTGLAEHQHGQWVFRNAHWSIRPAAP